MHVILNARGDVLAYVSQHDGPKFHDDPKFARRYRTLKGARCAATVWGRRFGMALNAVRMVTRGGV